MAPPRPRNHAVSPGGPITLGSPGRNWPEVSEDLLVFLEGVYPPRCYAPGREDLETHLVYSGQADLVLAMREAFDQQKAEALALDPEDDTAHSVEVDHPEQED